MPRGDYNELAAAIAQGFRGLKDAISDLRTAVVDYQQSRDKGWLIDLKTLEHRIEDLERKAAE